MDGIHDLGGRQGFGKVEVDEPEEAFHHAWEGTGLRHRAGHEPARRLEHRLVSSLP